MSIDEKALAQEIQNYNFKGDYGITKTLVPEALKNIPMDNIFLRNKLLNELEIAEGKTIIESKPRRLTVTLSNKCNLSCIMCLTSRFKWDMPHRCIEEIYSMFPYLEKVMWQGGEVFALDYFADILDEGFRHPNLRHSIVTNGQLITEKIAERLVNNNVELTVSVDGVTKDVYEHIRRGADFEVLLRNLKLISGLKKRHKPYMALNLNVAVMKSNYRQLTEFIEFGREYGFNFICLMPIHIHLPTPEDIFTNNDIEALRYITDASAKIDEMAKDYGIRVENRLPRISGKCASESIEEIKIPPSGKLLCHIPWQQLLIDFDGSVRPDCLCRHEKRAGNLSQGASLNEIWNNPVMQEYRKQIVEHDFSGLCNPICASGKICESHLKIP
jgi:MoaA/NifB/PqqE/SkfB family radical SAM enzyme